MMAPVEVAVQPVIGATTNLSAAKAIKPRTGAKKGPKRGAKAAMTNDEISKAESNQPDNSDLGDTQQDVDSTLRDRQGSFEAINKAPASSTSTRMPNANASGLKKRHSTKDNESQGHTTKTVKTKISSQQEGDARLKTPKKQKEGKKSTNQEEDDFAEPADVSGDFIEPNEPSGTNGTQPLTSSARKPAKTRSTKNKDKDISSQHSLVSK